jgi:hypothetical protein
VSTLLEAAAALAISGMVMLMMTGELVASARLHEACLQLTDRLFTERQLEQLVDRAVLAAGNGPAHPAPISSLSSDTVVFAADQNGDGSVDSTSSETTALEVRPNGREARVRVRLGRQTMTVLTAADTEAMLSAVDRYGRAASATTATLVELALAPRGSPSRESSFDDGERRMFFAIAAGASK